MGEVFVMRWVVVALAGGGGAGRESDLRGDRVAAVAAMQHSLPEEGDPDGRPRGRALHCRAWNP